LITNKYKSFFLSGDGGSETRKTGVLI
jgi:hypothetical protein